MKKFIFIINPLSGRGKALALRESIEKVCEKRQRDYEIIFTKAPHDATTIAKSYRRDDVVLFSVGGDGTLNEVINGVADGVLKARSQVSVIPGGSGNDFYKTLKLRDEEEFLCDVGKINDRYFINVASVGLDSEIGENAILMKRYKWLLKSQIYTASVFYTLAKAQDHNYKIKIDKSDEMRGKKTMITIANGRYYGGKYMIAPNAELDDGRFDVYVVQEMPRISKLGLLLKLIRNKHEDSSKVRLYKTKRLTIESDNIITAGIDGESFQDKKFKIEIYPQLINFYNNQKLVDEILNYEKTKVKKR